MVSPIDTLTTGAARRKTNDEIAAESKARQKRMQETIKGVYESMKGKKLSGQDRVRNPDPNASPRLPTPRPSDGPKPKDKPSSTSNKMAPKPVSRPAASKSAPKLEGSRDVKPAPKATSAMEYESKSGKSFPAGGPDGSRTSGDRDSRGGLGYRIGKALGDKRSEAQMIADRKATEKMQKEER